MRELHGLADVPKLRGNGEISSDTQQVQVIDFGSDAVAIKLSADYPAKLTAEAARYLARMLIEAADRVDPNPKPVGGWPVSRPEPFSVNITEKPDAENWDERPVSEPPVVAPLPSVAKPLRKSPTPTMWTGERNEMMRREVPHCHPGQRDELLAKLRALPGPPIPHVGRLGTQAAQLGLKWPPAPEPSTAEDEGPHEPIAVEPTQAPVREIVPELPDDSVVVSGPTLADAIVPPNGNGGATVPMTLDQVEAYASRRGILFRGWEDLPSVNADFERLNGRRIERTYPKIPKRIHFTESP